MVAPLLFLAPWLLRRPRLAAVFRPNPIPRYMDWLPAQLAVRPEAIFAMAAEVRGFNRAMIPLALRMRRLTVRTVVVAGEDDHVPPWERYAGWLVRRLPDSAGACLTGTDHMAHHVRPAMVAAALESAWGGAGKSLPGRL